MRKLAAASFLEAKPPERLALLEQLDREQKAYMDARRGNDTPVHYFRMMKELALLGYFTSEIGYTQAMRYEAALASTDGWEGYRMSPSGQRKPGSTSSPSSSSSGPTIDTLPSAR